MTGDTRPHDDERARQAAALRARAAAFLDLWERHVSEHALRGPGGAEDAARADEP
ncbi:hypothetical protein [Pikeienuella sp. HZG-20]|uniref:hypothetical protein n=1 Tax=Paludibacillus litoralis TaxID=3133267 RepID=UPI0030EB3340